MRIVPKIASVAMALTAAGIGSIPVSASAESRVTGCSTTMNIARINVHEPVQFYNGAPDDGRGTAIQNTGILASPVGRSGGVEPGQTGNFHVDGHRNTAGGPLHDLVDMQRGDLVKVRVKCAGRSDTTYTYSVNRRPRYINFFTEAGRAKQLAPRPFHVGQPAENEYLTISTCATQEDAARGEHRRDRYGNPPGRFVVIATLARTTRHPIG